VGHAQLDLAALLVGEGGDDVVEGVAAGLGGPGQSTGDVGGTEDAVLADELVLGDGTEDAATGDEITDVEAGGDKVPLLVVIEVVDGETTGNEDGLGLLCDDGERTLNTIENRVHDTRTKLDLKGGTSTLNGVTDGKTSGILINLDRGSITNKLDDLTDKFKGTDTNEFVHTRSGHLIGDNH
jgi:hypothetical protein